MCTFYGHFPKFIFLSWKNSHFKNEKDRAGQSLNAMLFEWFHLVVAASHHFLQSSVNSKLGTGKPGSIIQETNFYSGDSRHCPPLYRRERETSPILPVITGTVYSSWATNATIKYFNSMPFYCCARWVCVKAASVTQKRTCLSSPTQNQPVQ